MKRIIDIAALGLFLLFAGPAVGHHGEAAAQSGETEQADWWEAYPLAADQPGWWENDPLAQGDPYAPMREAWAEKPIDRQGPFRVTCYQQGAKIFDRSDVYQLVQGNNLKGWESSSGATLILTPALRARDTACFLEQLD